MPLTLDYDLNDIADHGIALHPERSLQLRVEGYPDHLLQTGLHRDYHYVTDEVDKILFPKMQRIAQLVYTTATRVGNLDHLPVRDNKGPRVGIGQTGKIR